MTKRQQPDLLRDNDDDHDDDDCCTAPLQQRKRITTSAAVNARTRGTLTNERLNDHARSAHFAEHGYAVVPHVLSQQELRVLQNESALLYKRAYASDDSGASASALALEQARA